VEATAEQPRARVVGRELEFAAIERLFSIARERFSALLLEGEVGIGKTTLFREALRMAAAHDLHVLACRAGASEATLSLAAISDLLEAVPAELLSALPPPQRRAIDVALLRIEPGEVPVDQRAVAAGLRSLVLRLAVDRPVVLAVDDVQWLDDDSATILEFVVRRLGPEHVALVATRRISTTARLDLEALSPPGALARVHLGPLSLGALQRALKGRLGTTLPRSTLVRVHAASHGNPLFALEIGRVLAERGAIAPGEPLPVPDDVRELVRARVGALPAATKDLLLATALLGHPTAEMLGRALGRTPDLDLEPAERAGIAALDAGVVGFAHPLHAAAVIATATAAERRRMHDRLAEVVNEGEERARHVAMAAAGPNERTARIVEQGAETAVARGGLQSAAELLERARTLTPAAEAERSHTRAIRAAELHMHAGDLGRARFLLLELLDERLTSNHRAEALRILADLALSDEDVIEAERLLHQALATAEDRYVAARIQTQLVYVISNRLDFKRAAECGHQALHNLAGTNDGPLLADALAYTANADFLAGRGVDWTKVESALELEDPDSIPLAGLPPAGVAALIMTFVGRHGAAREHMAATLTRLAERGNEVFLGHALIWMSWLELRCGNLSAAAGFADQAITTTSLAGNNTFFRWAAVQRALVDAHLGEVDSARQRCMNARPPDKRGVPEIDLWIAATLTLTGLSVGDHEAAWEASRELTEAVEEHGIGEPTPLIFLSDALEALVALGQLDRAEALIETFERRGRELDRIWARATAGRCRGLLLAARGDLPGATAALHAAVVQHERIEMRFERARTLLVRGMIERRARRRSLAKRSLDEAALEFERMGAALWAERAGSELARLGGRPSPGEGELTPSERQVVELASEGLSNKEIAARLVISVHTVEVHLSHAYVKLGIRSRAQLAARLAAEV
jgi:DNA-binding CsgD family transcriptional regulator